jgi:hypothetical protein
MKNFKVCGAKKLIKEDLEESEFDDVRYNVNVPGVE